MPYRGKRTPGNEKVDYTLRSGNYCVLRPKDLARLGNSGMAQLINYVKE